MGGRQQREEKRREKSGARERINRDIHKRDGGGGRNSNKKPRGGRERKREREREREGWKGNTAEERKMKRGHD